MDYLARQFLSGMWRKSVVIPVGGIILWSGSIASIPANFRLCDGNNGTPDLRDRFIVGAGSAHAPDATGGADTNNLAHSHNDGTLTTGNESSHTHLLATGGDPMDLSGPNAQYQNPTLAGTAHNHPVSGSTDSAGSAVQENRPAFYALAFIMRIL